MPRPAELNRVAAVESLSAGIGNASDYLFGFLKSNSRLETWLLKLCLLRGRRCRFVDFSLGLKKGQARWWGAPASFPGHL